MKTLAVLKFPTHAVYISQDTSKNKILVFKHNQQRCDMDIFSDGDSAGEFVLEPLPDHFWQVVIEDK